jgi:CelD/BcsL family acetyltransferase involved in cellulose biosynthesis
MLTNTLHQPIKADTAARTIELLSGQEVMDLIRDPDFLTQWDQLYQTCPWGTVFQTSRFVVAWYHTYEKEYLPILIRDTQDGQLTGLLTLAVPKSLSTDSNIHNKHPLIMGAGMYEAEYQTWLALPLQSESFIKQAFREIKKRFPKKDMLLRFLPPEVPLDWISKSPRWKQRIEIQAFKRPIMDLQAPDVTRMFRKAEFRNKLNRLKRLGDFSFEQITDLAALQSILEEITVQYDFRQGAMFNMNQFRDNPLKSDFLLEMFKQGLLHVTVLKAEGRIIASIMAVQDGEWVHLAGINIHSPFYANFSPGFVHFLLLGQRLSQEGIAYFDLTPGGDPYKERMANRHDVVHELVICNNLPYRAKRFLRKNKHNLLTKAGIRPMTFDLLLEKRLYLLKGKLKAVMQRGITKSIIQKIKARFFGSNSRTLRIAPANHQYSEQLQVQQNNLSDLLNYKQKGSNITRWEFTEDAMRRFEAGQQAYTWSEHGCLLACVWLSSSKSEQLKEDIPEGAALLENLYCHPAAHARAMNFVTAVAASVASTENKPVYLAVDLTDLTLGNILQQASDGNVSEAESYYINSQQGAA